MFSITLAMLKLWGKNMRQNKRNSIGMYDFCFLFRPLNHVVERTYTSADTTQKGNNEYFFVLNFYLIRCEMK